MPSAELKPPAIFVVGPTAVGKSSISISLAEQINGEIVSADSRLFYRGMDIGTDKPSAQDRARIRHHLIDVADPDETWSLADFQTSSRAAIIDIRSRSKLPILVGGTGQYVRSLTEGWVIPRQAPDLELRNELEGIAAMEGSEELFNRLQALDPQAAESIGPHNTRRLVRALDVISQTGSPFSEQRRRSDPIIVPIVIGLISPRLDLYARIDWRIDEMFQMGFVDEVQALLEKGYSPELPSFSAIGYREVASSLAGEISLEEVIVIMKRKSRQLVRRQANWFKQEDPNIHWFWVGDDTLPLILNKIEHFLLSIKFEKE